jgi:hypothetical protein
LSVYHATNAVTPDASANYVLIAITLLRFEGDVPLIPIYFGYSPVLWNFNPAVSISGLADAESAN